MPLANRMDRFKRYMGKPLISATAPPQQVPSRPGTATSIGFRRILGRKSVAPAISLVRTSISSPIPITVMAFVDQITVESLSHFLLWFFYYEIVELPVSPTDWYKYLPSMEMRGWIELGNFLQKQPLTGYQLVRLDSVIDRLQLRKQFIFHCIEKISKPDLMRFSEVAANVQLAANSSTEERHVLQVVQSCLQAIKCTTRKLQPQASTTFHQWQADISGRVTEYLVVVVNPRFSMARGKMRMLSGKTEDEEACIRYLYEAMQAERPVPLVRYGIFPTPSRTSEYSQNSSQLSVISPEDAAREADQESQYSIDQLRHENKQLRQMLEALQAKNEQLLSSRPLPHTPSAFSAIIPKRRSVTGQHQVQQSASTTSVAVNAMHRSQSSFSGLPLDANDIQVQERPETASNVPMPPTLKNRTPTGVVGPMIPDCNSSKPASTKILNSVLESESRKDYMPLFNSTSPNLEGKGGEFQFEPYPTDSFSSRKSFIPPPLFANISQRVRALSNTDITGDVEPSSSRLYRRRSKSVNMLERPSLTIKTSAPDTVVDDRSALPSQMRVRSSGSLNDLARSGIRGVSGTTRNVIDSRTPNGSVIDRPRHDTEFYPNAPALARKPTPMGFAGGNESDESSGVYAWRSDGSTPEDSTELKSSGDDEGGPTLKQIKRGGMVREGDGSFGFQRSSGLMGGEASFFGNRNFSGGHRDLQRLG